MKNFRKHMVNEHPCILEKFDAIDEELKKLNNSWIGTTLLLGLTADNEEVDITNSENVTKESYFELMNCKEIYLRVMIAGHTFNNSLYNRLFKSDIETGGMGENTVYFRSVPMKQGDGKLHTLVLRFWNNYAETSRKIMVYDEIMDKPNKITSYTLNGEGGFISDYKPLTFPTIPQSMFANYMSQIRTADELIYRTLDTDFIFKKCSYSNTSLYFLSALPTKIYVLQVGLGDDNTIIFYTYSISSN